MVIVKTKERIYNDKLAKKIHLNSMNKVTGCTSDVTKYPFNGIFKQYTGCLIPMEKNTYRFILTYVEYGRTCGVSRLIGINTEEEKEIVESVLKNDYKLNKFTIS